MITITELENGDILLKANNIIGNYLDFAVEFMDSIQDYHDYYFIDGGDGWTRFTDGFYNVWLVDGYGYNQIQTLFVEGEAVIELSSMKLEEYGVNEYGEIIK
jgi:hypothetical protein